MKKNKFLKWMFACLSIILMGIPDLATAKVVEPVRDGLVPGESRVTKTATPVEGMVNQWDVTLKVEGRNVFPPPETDVVLVIDNSNSMGIKSGGYTRMYKAKIAATKFVEQMLQDGFNNRVGIVTYGTSANQVASLTDVSGKDKLLNAINGSRSGYGIQANGGGTHTQEAIRKGSQLLESSGKSDARKILVLISDGEPTYSYDVKSKYKNNTNNMTFNPLRQKYVTSENIPESGFSYPGWLSNNRIGDGREMFLRNGFIWSNKFISMGNNAISESNIWKNKKNSQGGNVLSDVYTVSVDMDKSEEGNTELPIVAEDGTDVLRKIASRPNLCLSVEGSQIEAALTRIAQELLSAVTNGNVTDPMGEGFELTDRTDNIKVSQGTYTVDNSGTIKWDTGTLADPVSSDPEEDIMYAEMTYRIDANKDVLNKDVLSIDGLAKTNGKTTFDYTDSLNKKVTKEFIVPEVKPTIVSLKKELKNSDGSNVTNSKEKFAVEIDTEGYGDGEYSIAPEEVEHIVHPWKDTIDYSVKEVLTKDQKYAVTISINGAETDASEAKFKFIKDSLTGFYQNQEIIIKNKSKSKILYIRHVGIPNAHSSGQANYTLFDASNSTSSVNLTSKSTNIDDPNMINSSLFTKFELPESLLENTQLKLKVNFSSSEESMFGYVKTNNKDNLNNLHFTGSEIFISSYQQTIDIDFSDTSEVWVTVFTLLDDISD